MPSHRATIWTAVLITLLICVVGAGVGMGYLVSSAKDTEKSLNDQITALQNQVKTAQAALTSETDTSDWKTYENKDLGFSIKYPKEYYTKSLTGTAGDDNYRGLIISDIKDMGIQDILDEKVHINIDTSINAKEMSDDELNTEAEGFKYKFEDATSSDITIGDLSGKKVVRTEEGIDNNGKKVDMPVIIYVFKKYTIWIHNGDTSGNASITDDNFQKMIEIVNTFKEL